jgi:hypothetical protein
MAMPLTIVIKILGSVPFARNQRHQSVHIGIVTQEAAMALAQALRTRKNRKPCLQDSSPDWGLRQINGECLARLTQTLHVLPEHHTNAYVAAVRKRIGPQYASLLSLRAVTRARVTLTFGGQGTWCDDSSCD